MITLDIKPYCNDCPVFEPDVNKTDIYAGVEFFARETTIRCKNRVQCRKIVEFFKYYCDVKEE